MATKTVIEESTGIFQTERTTFEKIKDIKLDILAMHAASDPLAVMDNIESAMKELLETYQSVVIKPSEESIKIYWDGKGWTGKKWGFVAKGLLENNPQLKDASEILETTLSIRKHIDNPAMTRQVLAYAIQLGGLVMRLRVRPFEPLVIRGRKSKAEKSNAGISSGKKRKTKAEANQAAIRREYAALMKRHGGKVGAKYIYGRITDTLHVSERTIRTALNHKPK